MTEEKLSITEFETWITPADALSRCPEGWGRETMIKWIDGRLEAGHIGAVARSVRPATEREVIRKMFVIPPLFWKGFPCLAEFDFWKTGDVTLYQRVGGGGHLIGDFFDVRFDPAGFAALPATRRFFPSEPDPEALAVQGERKTRHGLPALRVELLNEWHALFQKAYPNGTKSLAEKSAQGMFPNHSVDRQAVRELFPNARRGRPPKTEDH